MGGAGRVNVIEDVQATFALFGKTLQQLGIDRNLVHGRSLPSRPSYTGVQPIPSFSMI